MAIQSVTHLRVEQYLEIERAAEFRSEYIDGGMVAMAGGGRNHALIVAAAGARLYEQLRGKPCAVAGTDLRVFCEPAQVLTYPDIVVFCEPAKFLDGDADTLVDATVILEVLSRSTQNYDRGEKFRSYRGLPSFREYVLLAEDEIRAEHHVRQPDGSWLFRELNGPEIEIKLDSIGCRLTLGSLYERAEFQTA
ncbi:MAG: Uma2 family endonuclease [Acidobacteriota bacterium]|nr:Uma2 family endonuclease [Acidobacteriota bacterium]